MEGRALPPQTRVIGSLRVLPLPTVETFPG